MPNSTEHVVRVAVKRVDDLHSNSLQNAAHLSSKLFEPHPTISYSMPVTKFYVVSEEYREEAINILFNSHEHDITVFDYVQT